MIVNDDKEGLKRKIEQLKTEIKCLEGLNREKLEKNVQLNIENVRLKNKLKCKGCS